MTTVFRYSIVRFQPFADLGEFANIGVLAINPQNGQAAFKLARKRFARLHDFFGDDAYRAYAPAIEYLRAEFGRLEILGRLGQEKEALMMFDHLTRRHESTITFSEVRAVMSATGIDNVVENLFARLVMRQLQEGNDLTLIGEIKHVLRLEGIKGFKAIRIDDEVLPVMFPLAHMNGDFSAIHPLSFTQKTPMAVFDHGALWRKRLGYLLNRGKIGEDAVLLAVEEPERDAAEDVQMAYNEAMRELSDLPFERVIGEQHGKINHRIIEFAEAATHKRYRPTFQ
ncbi:hypothetical protein TomMM35A_18210 [Sphingobium sp. TomMM35A]